MIYSMTGFAVVNEESPVAAVNVELRSVNHRYLDIQMRIPDELRVLEPTIRELIVRNLTRGKIDCRVSYARTPSSEKPLQVNLGLLQQLVGLTQTIKTVLPDARNLSAADVLRWPGILNDENALLSDELQQICLKLLERAIAELQATRAREGNQLKEMLMQRIIKMEELVKTILPRMPQLITAYQEKLGARLREVMASNDEERIKQEVALFATKIDIAEEVSRLQTHLIEARRILSQGGAAGKRLDFLMQELNREANTFGSKAVDSEATQIAMELKILIEQMREQIQNIE